nr:MAG: hypothetical protein DIU57_09885 [Pseudomonadota bacterium]
MPQGSCSLKATRLLLVAITVAYFFVPILVVAIVGDELYIYSQRQSESIGITIVFGAATTLLVIGITRGNKPVPLPSSGIIRQLAAFYYVSIAFVLALAAYGAYLRDTGASRLDLLEKQSELLFPGFGLICLLGCIHAIAAPSHRKVALMVLVFVVTDVMFMGKIFTYIAAGVVVLRWDYRGHAFRLRHALALGLVGMIFLGAVHVMRAVAVGEESLLIDFYTFFSEFLGVQATVGWSIEYFESMMPDRGSGILRFVHALNDYYADIVGHGLALSPAAYFYGLFGPLWGPLALSYMILLFLAFRLAYLSLGYVAIFVLAYNYQHLMRHGVDVFTTKVVTQLLLVAFLFKVLPRYTGREPSTRACGLSTGNRSFRADLSGFGGAADGERCSVHPRAERSERLEAIVSGLTRS